jgi:hypothetical protein
MTRKIVCVLFLLTVSGLALYAQSSASDDFKVVDARLTNSGVRRQGFQREFMKLLDVETAKGRQLDLIDDDRATEQEQGMARRCRQYLMSSFPDMKTGDFYQVEFTSGKWAGYCYVLSVNRAENSYQWQWCLARLR